jgi:ABC-type transport system involved in multi-copper enzyme maturation permease subunit
MTFLPIVERELRVRARLKATFRTRIGAALTACLIIGFFLVGSRVSPAGIGKTVFWFVSVLAFVWCLFEGPRNTADALSEEKREGTLGLLFLTDLKGYDVVLGKLLATSLHSFYGVLAIVPPLSIPLLLGGVTVGEFWRMVLVLLVTLLFSLSASLFISANSRNERRAWVGAVLLIAFLAVVPPLFRWMPFPSMKLLGAVSPTPALYSLRDAFFTRQPQAFWHSVLGVHAMTWGFLIAACLVLPRSWQDKPVQRANRERTLAHRQRSREERQRQMDANPVVWMLTGGKRAEWYVWALIALLGLPFIGVAFIWDQRSLFLGPFIIAAVAVNLLLAVWVAAKACFMISDARASGALALLLTTPTNQPQIIASHMEALKRQFLPPFISLTMVEFVVVRLLIDYPSETLTRGGEVAGIALVMVVVAGLFGAQLFSCAWFGLWCGLTAKKAAQALVKTLTWVIVLPIFFGMCSCLAPVLILIKDAMIINYASSRLQQQFRTIVTEGLPANSATQQLTAGRKE